MAARERRPVRWRVDATGPRSARMVLGGPGAQTVPHRARWHGAARPRVRLDRCRRVTDITADHLGHDGRQSIEDIAYVKALLAERVRDGGTLVLDADDPCLPAVVDASSRQPSAADRIPAVTSAQLARRPPVRTG
ncbi:Mur ligase family protein [Wenjunlia tyrosinilytica]|uniref:Mur ligase family protein n=1 Tax=Wenjunlia tyrosinilytica TaxID=1544741 RepID=UPI001E368FB0|nr:Mur ligase family protein [Wenjunlia tyrosinilytica]